MKVQTAIQLRVVTHNGDGNQLNLNPRQQSAIDEFVNNQVADALNKLADDTSALVTALLQTQE